MNALIEEFLLAKRLEEEAKERRIEAEQAILGELYTLKPEGQTRVKDSGYVITVTTSFNRRIDTAALQVITDHIPKHVMDQAIRWKPEVNLTGLRYLHAAHPEHYITLSQAITTTPAKPSIRIEKEA